MNGDLSFGNEYFGHGEFQFAWGLFQSQAIFYG